MVPQPKTVTRQRYEALTGKRKPLITYGSSKPLPLSGTQFIRRNVYDIPSDDEAEYNESGASRLLQATSDGHGGNGDESSQLSGASEPISRRETSRVDVLEAAKASRPPDRNAEKKRSAQAVQQPKLKPARRPATKPPPARRLPVGELFCVVSPPQYGHEPDSSSGALGIEIQDPIDGEPSQLPLSSERRKAPLSAHRSRLKTPKFRYKSRTVLRGKPQGQGKLGDGFDNAELKITYCIPIPRRQRRRKASVNYRPLKVAAGPLPEVCFDCPADELQLEPSGGPHHVSSEQDHETDAKPLGSSQRPRRNVSFSDRDEVILAQLSSMSAPVYHDSDEESDEEDDEDAEVGTDDGEDEVGQGSGSENEDDEAEDTASPAANPKQPVRRVTSRQWRLTDEVDNIEEDDDHVARYVSARLGSLPRRTGCTKEVDEAVEDVFPEAPLRARTTAATRCSDQRLEQIEDDESFLSIDRSRPRSILKNSTFIPESSFRPEHTAANTRRNSLIDVDESSYFTSASGMLDEGSRKHTIVPRRRSSYFEPPAEVEVPDSDSAVVLETSQFFSTNVGASRGKLEPPAIPRDLRSLTRAVSRENGTVSQSALRRRPSLPFQSPVKVR